MDYKNDNRIVLTLDAGGTNLVFNAVQAQQAAGGGGVEVEVGHRKRQQEVFDPEGQARCASRWAWRCSHGSARRRCGC